MQKFFNILANELYYDYFVEMAQGSLISICEKVEGQKDLFYMKTTDPSIVMIKKGENIFINSAFILEISSRIGEYIERDVSLFKTNEEMRTHFYYAILYVFHRIQNYDYLVGFCKRFPTSFYE